MSKKEEIYEFFNKNLEWDRQRAIKQSMTEFGVTETTAITYYQAWRKDYMQPKTSDKSFKKELGEAIKKSGISTSIAIKESKAEITKESIENPIKLIPVMFKGPVFTFEINKIGIKIVDGESEMVTEDIIKEQQEAIRIFKDLYGIGYKKESELI